MGAFAQKPIKYEPIPEPCLYVFDFVPKCNKLTYLLWGTYELSVCGDFRLQPGYDTMNDQLMDYLCQNGVLPGNVSIVKFTPFPDIVIGGKK
jgi:hypothetical protein